jgi:hypothetical protein
MHAKQNGAFPGRTPPLSSKAISKNQLNRQGAGRLAVGLHRSELFHREN